MEYIKVESSNIDSIGFENNELFVRFKTGNLYKYSEVDRTTFLEMLGSKSRGRYLNENIKNKYTCTRVE